MRRKRRRYRRRERRWHEGSGRRTGRRREREAFLDGEARACSLDEEEASTEGILTVAKVKGNQRPSSSSSSSPPASFPSSSFCRLVTVSRIEEEASGWTTNVAQNRHVV